MKISIGKKLAGLIGVLLLAPAILALATFFQSHRVESKLQQITGIDAPASKLSLELEIHALAAGTSIIEYVQDFDEKHLEGIAHSLQEFERQHVEFRGLADHGELVELGSEIENRFDQFRASCDKLVEMAGEEKLAVGSFFTAYEEMNQLLGHPQSSSLVNDEARDSRKKELESRLELLVARIAANLAEALKMHDSNHRKLLEGEMENFENALADLHNLSLSKPEELWLSEVENLYAVTVSEAEKALMAEDSMMAEILLFEKGRASLHEILDGQIQEIVHDDMEIAKTEAHAGLVNLNRTVFGVALGAIVIGLVCTFAICRSIFASMKQLTGGVKELSDGNLKHRIQRVSRDELGDLSDSFNYMAENLDNQQLAICEAISRLQTISMEILASTSQQASGMEEQNASVTETVTTMKELGQTAEEAADRAGAVKDVIKQTVEVGDSGRDAVERSVAAMDKVRQQVNSIAEDNLGLAERAQAIGDIISTVNDVTDQTNLLALNAAVEAARAGEYGKGFGVVAAEIKALAEQSREATQQVSQILGDIQKATNAAVLATEQGTRDADEATKVVQEAGNTITQLTGSLEETSLMAAQISASAGQQAIGVKQVNEAMGQLQMVAREQASATRQVEGAMEDVQSLSCKLQELVGESGDQVNSVDDNETSPRTRGLEPADSERVALAR